MGFRTQGVALGSQVLRFQRTGNRRYAVIRFHSDHVKSLAPVPAALVSLLPASAALLPPVWLPLGPALLVLKPAPRLAQPQR